MNKYEAGKGRLIIKPIELEQQGEMINADDNYKLNLAEVISCNCVGKSMVEDESGQTSESTWDKIVISEYKKGDTIVYAKNSGMPLPPIGDQVGYIVINEVDVFAKYKKDFKPIDPTKFK